MKRWLTMAAVLAAFMGIAAASAAAAPEQGSFEFESSEAWLRTSGKQGATPELRAGAHPEVNTTFVLDTSGEVGGRPYGVNPKDVEVTLPPGLIGNPQAVPTCTQAEFFALVREADCDPATQVGEASLSFYLKTKFPLNVLKVPIYNIAPPSGVAAQFAFDILGVPVYINANVAVDGNYTLKAVSKNISQGLDIAGTSITLWGVPASHDYDQMRTPKGGANGPEGLTIEGAETETPFMSNPTNCSGTPLRFDFLARPWRNPAEVIKTSAEAGTVTDCEDVPFEASMSVHTTSTQAESPTGLDVDVDLPQTETIDGVRSSDLRDAVVTLPEGMTINPASAGGLTSCTAAQIGLGTEAAPTCPQSSRVGSLEMKSPLLEEQLTGSIFLAQQKANKFGSLMALYLVIEDPARGVLIKVPGKVELDPDTGRLVTSFEETPQLPLETLRLTFFGGPRAPLMTPTTCGIYPIHGEFSPWSGNATVAVSDSFRITSGPEGSACPTGGFAPAFEAGTSNPAAGQFSPLEMRFSRADGSQRLSAVSVALPAGLLAKLAGIPYCPDATLAAIPAGEGTAAAENAAPACPAASRVGSVAVSTGAGPSPFWEKTGSAYLAGPYKGAPLSLAVVVPALAGPFDLGNVVVRTALDIDPATAAVTATSDPLPTILHGIPLDLRELRVTLDRSRFTVNPTSCAGRAFAATIASVGGADAQLGVPFAASSCGGLGFAPQLSLRLKGGTRRGAFPALRATLKAAPGQADIRRVAVSLPHSEFLEQGHIGTVCTRVQFATDACPAKSVYGWARAFTPLLDQPLEGPVYLRSSSHKLPDLVADLSGQIQIELDGRIDSVHGGIRTTFESLPDAPVSKFVLSLQGGKKSLLVNSADVCDGTHRAQVRAIGQNGREHNSQPSLGAGCGKKK